MKKPLTPGRIALYAIGVWLLWAVLVAIPLFFVDADWASSVRMTTGWIVWIGAGVALLVALIAKAVQIGVRSSRD